MALLRLSELLRGRGGGAGRFQSAPVDVNKTRSHSLSYAKPSTIPRTRKMRNTLWAEWRMTAIQVLRKRRAGYAYRTPLTQLLRMPHGWLM
jgi:hypothetical protein